MRLLLAASAGLLFVTTACGGDNGKVACVLSVGATHTTVSLNTKVGASSVATVGRYTVTFSVLDDSKLKAEVRDANSTLMTLTAGDASGKASGSTGTPDGRLDFSCAP